MIKVVKHRFGSHVKLEDTIINTFKTHPGLLTLQVYMGKEISYSVKKISEADKDDIRSYMRTYNRTLYIHAPLITNLSKVDENMDIHSNSMSTITSLLTSVKTLPIGVVLHIGAKGTIEKVIEHINDLINDDILVKSTSRLMKAHLLLEVSAGQGTQLGSTWEEVELLSNSLDPDYVGLCLDTAHMFGSGMCKFDSLSSIDSMFNKVDSLRLSVQVIHINDSKVPFGSKKDRHEVLGRGYIWGSEETYPALEYFIKCCFDRKIDLISETPDTEADITLMKSLSK